MLSNRPAVFLDACVLAGALKRNLILTLAEAEFFRVCWSKTVLDEAEKAIGAILRARGAERHRDLARRARTSMEIAFEDASVGDFDAFFQKCRGLPDPDDTHVVVAALKGRAAFVTDNLKHFPAEIMSALDIEIRSSDTFLADAIALDLNSALVSIRRMRHRFKRPEKSAAALLRDIRRNGLVAMADLLEPHVLSL